METNQAQRITASDAIKTKYIDTQNNLTDNSSSDGFVILVRVHGAGDRHNFSGIPTNLVLENLGIIACGNKDFLIEKCRNRVKEVDLSHNELTDWNEIVNLLETINSPDLVFINLSYNDLSSPIIHDKSIEKFPNLKSLILVGTNINWTSLWKFLKETETLDELNLSKNNFHIVELLDPKMAFPSVKNLMFNGNPISNWNEVSKLGLAFPNLEQLSLSNCEISSIPKDGDINFQNLKTLWLSSNPLHEMDDLANLRQFAKLMELRILGTQILPELTDHERREFITGLLPNITKVNGGAFISESERETAERAFIRFFDKNSHMKKPSRYNELKLIHGELHPLVEINLKPAKTVKLKFSLDEIQIEKSVSVFLTIKELKVLLEPLIGIQAKNQRLFYVDGGLSNVVGREEMKFLSKKLYSYNMKDGDEIQIDIKN